MEAKSVALKQDLTLALARLKKAIGAEPTDLNRDATIQRYPAPRAMVSIPRHT